MSESAVSDEIRYCSNIIFNGDSEKEYFFDEGFTFKLDLNTKIVSYKYSDIILIKNKDHYGFVYKNINGDPVIVEPKYNTIYRGKYFLYAEDDEYIYLIAKKDGLPITNYIDNVKKYKKNDKNALIDYLKNNIRKNINEIFESDGNYIIETDMTINIFNIETGKLISQRGKFEKATDYFDGGDILVFEKRYVDRKYEIYNLETEKKCDFIDYYSAFINGKAVISNVWMTINDKTYYKYKIIDKDFNTKTFKYKPVINQNIIITYRDKILVSRGIRHKRYGFVDFDNNLLIPFKYNSIDEAKAALDEYLDKQKINAQDINLLSSNSTNKNEKTINILENEIEQLLKSINNSNLTNIYEEKKSKYKSQISDIILNDKKNRKNIIFGDTPILSNNTTARRNYNDYLNELKKFKDFLKNDQIINILLDLYKMLDITSGKEVELNDELLKNVKTLYNMILELDDELEKKNIDRLRNIINKYINYFNEVISDANSNDCKYDSRQSWEVDFRNDFQKLIYQFKEDYDLEQVNHSIKNISVAKQELDNNKYNIIYFYANEINKTIKEIEDMTADSDLLELLDGYRNIEIDYSIPPEDTIRILKEKLIDIYKLKENIQFINEPDNYGEYTEKR